MSSEIEIEYEIRRAKKRKLYLSRIGENTRLYLARYQKMYRECKGKGFFDYIPDEMNRLKRDLDLIQSNIDSDIEYAMQTSKDVGDYIHSYNSTYFEVKNQIEKTNQIKQERLSIEKAQEMDRKSKLISEKLLEIKDPVIRDFAYDLSLNLKKDIGQSTSIEDSHIKAEFEKIIDKATIKANEWKIRQVQKYQKETEKEKIKAQIKVLQESNKIEKSEKVNQIISDLKDINNDVSESNLDEIREFVKEKCNKAENEILDERIRKEVVKSLYSTLKKEGFLISNPQIDKSNNVVLLKANKPSGHRANCKIELNGKFSYRFDNYEGMSCLKDIEKVNKDLKDIYGIEIKKEKTIWENPNRALKDAHSMPSSNQNGIGE